MHKNPLLPGCRGKPATSVCSQQGCTSCPIMCSDPKCNCRTPHRGHHAQSLTTLSQRLTELSTSFEDYLRICEAIDSLVSMEVAEFLVFKEEYSIDTGYCLKSLRLQAALMQNLLTAGDLDERATGADINELLGRMEQIKDTTDKIMALKELNLQNNQVTDEAAKAVAVGFPQLTSLIISGNQLTDKGAQAIALGMQKLTILHIGQNSLTYDGVQAIALNLTHLTLLNISWNNISSEGARTIARSLPQLTQLYIRANNVTDEGAKAIARGLAQLNQLSIEDNMVTDQGAKAISQGLPYLGELDIGNNQLTQRSKKVLALTLPKTFVDC